MTETVWIEISKDLFDQANSKVDNVYEFIEQQLIILINNDFTDEYEILVQLTKKIDEIKELERRLTHIRKNRIRKVIDTTIFDDSMVIINRIYDNLGMIGKNQIRDIAKRNNVPYDALLEFVEKQEYTVVNYTGVKK